MKLTRGTLEKLGREIDKMVEKEYYFQESCKCIEIDREFFDVILCADVVHVRLFGHFAPALFCDKYQEKSETITLYFYVQSLIIIKFLHLFLFLIKK